MAFPPVTVPAFPNVPQALGVPAVARSILFPPSSTPAPINTDGPGVGQTSAAPAWGLFDDAGNQALTSDSFVSFDKKAVKLIEAHGASARLLG